IVVEVQYIQNARRSEVATGMSETIGRRPLTITAGCILEEECSTARSLLTVITRGLRLRTRKCGREGLGKERKMNDKSSIVVLDERDLDIIKAETKPSNFPVSKGNFPVSK